MKERILKYFEMDECKPVSKPLPAGPHLIMDSGEVLGDSTPYRQLVSALMELADTARPDIAFALHYLVRFLHVPTMGFWRADKPTLRYLKTTPSVRIRFLCKDSSEWRVFSNAHLGHENLTRKLIRRYLIM